MGNSHIYPRSMAIVLKRKIRRTGGGSTFGTEQHSALDCGHWHMLRGDPSTALKYYHQAAKERLPLALIILALFHEFELGGEMEADETMECYLLACEAGDHFAKANLALFTGTPRSGDDRWTYSSGSIWLRLLAISGNTFAQHRLNELKFTSPLNLNHERESPEPEMTLPERLMAASNLAISLLGDHNEQIVDMAMMVLDWAAECDHGPALYQLGLLYESGEMGLVRSPTKAVDYYFRAVAVGSDEAACKLEDLIAESISSQLHTN